MDRDAGRPETDEITPVVRRLVLFAHGFDPRGPAPYHALMHQDAAPGSWEVGPRRGRRWTLGADWPEGRAETRFDLLAWDDLVRTHWVRGRPDRWLLPYRFLQVYVRAGVVSEAIRSNRPLFLAMILPATLGLTHVLMVVALAAIGMTMALPVARTLGLDPWWGLVGMAAASIAWPLARAFQRWIDLDWLSQCFDALARFRQMPADREARLDDLARRIVEATLEDRDQDVIVVGHSIGSIMAAGAVGRALAIDPSIAPRLTLLTIGQCLSIYQRLGGDANWAADLASLVQSGLKWIDVTSPIDGASSGRWPVLRFSAYEGLTGRVDARSPRFHESLSPERMSRLRRDPRSLHFQYLRLSDRPEIYDIRRLVAGPPDARP